VYAAAIGRINASRAIDTRNPAMCVNYLTVSKNILRDLFDAPMHAPISGASDAWPDEAYQDYPAPIIRNSGGGRREALVATYGMVPKARIPPGVRRFSTMNARAETVDQLRSFAPSWKAGQLCLVPMLAFFEPNWESGSAVRWKIVMADELPFAVAGLYRCWREADGSASFSFTQLTINADQHPLLRRFHRPGDEKRSLVIVPRAQYDAWLGCTDAGQARAHLRLYPPELLLAAPAPKPRLVKPIKPPADDGQAGETLSLF
jgi:putative SOS response-associated peptidase YedK